MKSISLSGLLEVATDVRLRLQEGCSDVIRPVKTSQYVELVDEIRGRFPQLSRTVGPWTVRYLVDDLEGVVLESIRVGGNLTQMSAPASLFRSGAGISPELSLPTAFVGNEVAITFHNYGLGDVTLYIVMLVAVTYRNRQPISFNPGPIRPGFTTTLTHVAQTPFRISRLLISTGPKVVARSPAVTFYDKVKILECTHPKTHRGEDAPLVYGSLQTEVCNDCHMFRTRGHDANHSNPGIWRPADEYEKAIREDHDV